MNNNNDKLMVYTSKNIHMLKDVPVLDNGQLYIYVMLNSPQGNIKIGKTTNIQQRLISLSGSNGGGNKIIKLYCSPATWIQTIEEAIHNHFNKYRIKGTEWFDGDNLSFDDVVKHVNELFQTESYKTCNRLRKQVIENEREKARKLQEKNIDEDLSKSNSKRKKGK